MAVQKGIWAVGFEERMNVTFGFYLDLESPQSFNMELVAGSVYRVYVDSKLRFFGPVRSAHGYARVNDFKYYGRKIAIEVYSPYIKSFIWLKESPFFACNIYAQGKNYTEKDFACYYLNDRVEVCGRYSYQRCFEEIYVMDHDRSPFYEGDENAYPRVEVQEVQIPRLLDNYTHSPELNVHYPIKMIEKGKSGLAGFLKGPDVRYHFLVGGELEGFRDEEIFGKRLIDEACQLYFKPNSTGDIEYEIYDFGRTITGFFELSVEMKEKGNVYLLFDELKGASKRKGKNYVDCLRNSTTNCFKWTLNENGSYELTSFEPYAGRYVVVVHPKNASVLPRIRDYENPDCGVLEFETGKENINKIFQAARDTLAQNAADLLTDCPSRERSGWLSDSYFSSVAERALTGDNIAEQVFLENYAYLTNDSIPKGMVSMNYPSDDFNGVYIPNWSMWYIMELIKFARNYPDNDIIKLSEKKIMGIFKFFEKYENEYGLLENLESWVFVEWSKANDSDHICGVNIPSNIHYQRILEDAGRLFGIDKWVEKAERIRSAIKELAFNGTLFVDNLVRNEEGKLVQTNNLTEVCQYYAFWFRAVDKREYKETYDLLMNQLGPNKKKGFMDEVCPPNMMYGIYMRLDLLMRDKKRKELLDECVHYLYPMANTTGTLWENTYDGASLDHAFASYSIKWLIYAITSYDIETNKYDSEAKGIGVNCRIAIPEETGKTVILINKDEVEFKFKEK